MLDKLQKASGILVVSSYAAKLVKIPHVYVIDWI